MGKGSAYFLKIRRKHSMGIFVNLFVYFIFELKEERIKAPILIN